MILRRVLRAVVFVCVLSTSSSTGNLPLVINTWTFLNATIAAVEKLHEGGTYLDAIVAGGTQCEMAQCDHSVGYGGRGTIPAYGQWHLLSFTSIGRIAYLKSHFPLHSSPDEKGETTLDAMIMDGVSHDVGAVGCLKNIKNAIGVARAVMEHTSHTLLVGDDATNFAVSMGYKLSNLTTEYSENQWQEWKSKSCQPNFWQKVTPDPAKNCGPYKPANTNNHLQPQDIVNDVGGPGNHDTIGIIVVDASGKIGAGTTTNGLTYKIPGRVGDSPIMGAGSYADDEVGGAVCTGDGDVMMRFLPSYQAVESMRQGKSPKEAADDAIQRINKYYSGFSGAIIVANIKGEYGVAASLPGKTPFPFCAYNPTLGKPTQFYLNQTELSFV